MITVTGRKFSKNHDAGHHHAPGLSSSLMMTIMIHSVTNPALNFTGNCSAIRVGPLGF
jgi:hypothetical protein